MNSKFLKHLYLALLLPLSAYAGTAQLTCTPPTLNTDGSAITGTITYNFYRGTSAATVTTKLTATPTTSCAYTDSAAPVGAQYYAATAIAGGQESAKSAVVSKVILAPVPNPPTGLTIADTVVYYPVAQQDKLVMIPVGTAPAGTACDTTQSVNGYYGVPRSTVVWYGSVKPLATFAQCS